MEDALISCPVCGASIARSSARCPVCGAYRPPIARFPALWGVLALIVVLLAVGGYVYYTQPITPEPVELQVDPAALVSAYAKNEVKADSQYNGAIITTTGEVVSVTVFMGCPCVSLSATTTADLICMFDSSTLAVEALAPGQTVTIRGTCTGTHMPNTVTIASSPGWSPGYVYLGSCTIQ